MHSNQMQRGPLLNRPLVLGNEHLNYELNICDELSVKGNKSLNLETIFQRCIFLYILYMYNTKLKCIVQPGTVWIKDVKPMMMMIVPI